MRRIFVLLCLLFMLIILRLTTSLAQTQPMSITDIALSANGKLFAVADTNAVWIYDASTFQILGSIPMNAYSVAWSPDNNRLAIGTRDGHMVIWNQLARSYLTRTGHDSGAIVGVTWNNDGTSLASAGSDGASVWDATTNGDALFTASIHLRSTQAQSVSYHQSGLEIVAGFADGTIAGFDAKTGQAEFLHGATLGSDTIGFAVWSPDGAHLLQIPADGQATIGKRQMIIWDTPFLADYNWKLNTVLPIDNNVKRAFFSPNGTKLALISDSQVEVFDTSTWQSISAFTDQKHIQQVTWSPNSKAVLIADPNQIVIRNVLDGSTITTINHRQLAQDAAGLVLVIPTQVASTRTAPPTTISTTTVTTPDWFTQSPLITAGNANKLVVKATIESSTNLDWFKFSPNGQYLAGSSIGTVLVWFLNNSIELQDPLTIGDGATHLEISPDGRFVAFDNGSDLTLWDSQTRKSVLLQHQDDIRSFAFSPDSKQIAVSTVDPGITIWDTSSGQQEITLDTPQQAFSVAYSPDGRFLAAGQRGEVVTVWDAAGRKLLSLKTGLDGDIEQVLFTSDGNYVVAMEQDENVFVWKTVDGTVVTMPDGATATAIATNPGKPQLLIIHLRQATLYDIPTFKRGVAFDDESGTGIRSIDFSPDHSLLFISHGAAQSEEAVIFNLVTNKQIGKIQGDPGGTIGVDWVSVHPSGKLVGLLTMGNKIILYAAQ